MHTLVLDGLFLFIYSVYAFINHSYAWCIADESIALQSKTKGPPCKQDENPLAGQIQGYSRPNLPEVRHNILEIKSLLTDLSVLQHHTLLDK